MGNNGLTVILSDEQQKQIIRELATELQKLNMESIKEASKFQYVTKAQLAELLNVSENSIMRMREQGMPYFSFGKIVRYNLNEVQEWMRIYNK
ncbi:helix-turn-helix domain-containing protein [Enterococcus plantarum]|uniref:helix-turn-helix domain-containing protein n=1 Tax=Enterococcus plantarum TaxID=1077675 RepID=UPI001A8DE9E1|nr:helix-turn-helix domain-containing protein [Enterococcus plantarum]MBO0423578.1 helix-turn-helix domain-containing protein [Enterococcus plantarum]